MNLRRRRPPEPPQVVVRDEAQKIAPELDGRQPWRSIAEQEAAARRNAEDKTRRGRDT